MDGRTDGVRVDVIGVMCVDGRTDVSCVWTDVWTDTIDSIAHSSAAPPRSQLARWEGRRESSAPMSSIDMCALVMVGPRPGCSSR